MHTGYRNPSRKPWGEVVDSLKAIFESWGVGPEDYHIDHNPEMERRELSLDWWRGEPWARVRYRPPTAPQSMVEMQLGSQSTAAKNLNSIAITLEAIRMQERRGLGGIAAAHYLAISAPLTARDPYEVLGVRPDAPLEVVEAAWRQLAKGAHPDKGGTEEAMTELNDALEAVKMARDA